MPPGTPTAGGADLSGTGSFAASTNGGGGSGITSAVASGTGITLQIPPGVRSVSALPTVSFAAAAATGLESQNVTTRQPLTPHTIEMGMTSQPVTFRPNSGGGDSPPKPNAASASVSAAPTARATPLTADINGSTPATPAVMSIPVLATSPPSTALAVSPPTVAVPLPPSREVAVTSPTVKHGKSGGSDGAYNGGIGWNGYSEYYDADRVSGAPY